MKEENKITYKENGPNTVVFVNGIEIGFFYGRFGWASHPSLPAVPAGVMKEVEAEQRRAFRRRKEATKR